MEIIGNYFIRRILGHTPSGEQFEYWEVGEVLVANGTNIFKISKEFGAETRENALIYLRNLAKSLNQPDSNADTA